MSSGLGVCAPFMPCHGTVASRPLNVLLAEVLQIGTIGGLERTPSRERSIQCQSTSFSLRVLNPPASIS